MDPTRFDALVRTFAAGRTRRRLVATIAALPLVGALTGISGNDVEAERPRDRLRLRKAQRRRKQRNRKRQNQNTNTGNGGGNNGGGGNNQIPPPGATSPPPLGATQCGSNGDVCFQDSDCCTNNCFNFQCAARVLQCSQGGISTNCRPPAKGCAGLLCCYGAVSCNDGCCLGLANQCNPQGNCCAPNCVQRECGDDGCGAGGTCGTCPSGQTCSADGQCQGSCVPQCRGRQCGPDGCGGTCGTCPTGSTCNDSSGQCLCTPDCTGKRCGSNGCGGSCGACRSGQVCTAAGYCTGPCQNTQDCRGEPGVDTCCDGLCIITLADRFNCGACGHQCAAGLGCNNNTCCIFDARSSIQCSATVPCCDVYTCQNGSCCVPSGSFCNGLPASVCCSGVCGQFGACT